MRPVPGGQSLDSPSIHCPLVSVSRRTSKYGQLKSLSSWPFLVFLTHLPRDLDDFLPIRFGVNLRHAHFAMSQDNARGLQPELLPDLSAHVVRSLGLVLLRKY